MESNILVKIGVGVLAMIAVVLGGIKFSQRNDAPMMASLPQVGGEPISQKDQVTLGLEADTPQDTVATLISEVRDAKNQMESLESTNLQLQQENEKLRRMENNLLSKLEGQMSNRADKLRSNHQSELDVMQGKIQTILSELEVRAQVDREKQSPINERRTEQANVVWVPPLTMELPQGPGTKKRFNKGLGQLPWIEDSADSKTSETGAGNEQPRKPVPVYTLAKNSTLLGATAFTALIGRVPVGKNVTDPYSFKVIIGRENLIANGHEIPQVAYAVVSGKAVGDWTMSCISGAIYSMTFVFNDGRIRTIPKPNDISDGGSPTQELKIGELADDFGNPCVFGSKVSNAATYLSARTLAAAAEAAADAAAASETTSTLSDIGLGSSTVIDGSTGKYVWDKTLAGAASETAAWVRDRQALEFDAIYVKPGAKVGIHLTEEIRIDYDPGGRRTIHNAAFVGGTYRALD